jgi:hypothetical protein
MREILATVLILAVTTACAPKTSRPQTEIMANTGKVGVSASVLRVRVNNLVDRSVGRIEQTADRVIAGTDDESIRRRARLVKVDAIPAVFTAGFRADPLAAAMDVWGFAFQFNNYMEGDAGRNAFGSQQPLFLACARDLLADADGVLKTIAIRPEYFDVARSNVQGWAKTNPVEQSFSSRTSAATFVDDFRSNNKDVFVTIGAVSDLIEDLSERLNAYSAQLPKQARWQAEILVTDVTGTPRVESALGDLREVGTAARSAATLLNDVPGLLEAQRNLIEAERRAVLEGVDIMRGQTQDYMTQERLAVLAAVHQERLALVEALQQERREFLREADLIRTRAVDSAMSGFRDLIDDVLWRIATFVVFLMLVTASIAAIAYRLASGRRRAAVTA